MFDFQVAKQLFGYEQVAKVDCEYPLDLLKRKGN